MGYTRLKAKAKSMNEFDAPLEKNVTGPMKDQPDVTAIDPSFQKMML